MCFSFYRKILSFVWLLLRLAMIFIFIGLPVCLVVLLNYFPNVTVNQIVFHILYLNVKDIFPYLGLIIGVLSLLCLFTFITYKRPYLLFFWITLYGYVFLLDPQYQNIKVSDIEVDKQIPLIKQIKLSLQWSDVYDKYYQKPQLSEPKNKKNIIFIFAESMEDNFADEKYWGENLIPDLSELKQEGYNFGGYEQINGTNWTLASNVATFCGVPLRMHLRDRLGMETRHFLPHIKCLPDILKDVGYHNVFVKGAYISFVGTDKFISEHSFDEMYGRDEMLIENYVSVDDVGVKEYGINDKKMFEFARHKISELAQNDEPFFISIQTLDTHFPNGFIHPSCEVKYSDSRDAIKCSQKTIYDFVRWVQQQNFWDNTIIIVAGDHLIMSASDIADLSASYPHRQIYNVILEKDLIPQIVNKTHSMMDWSATIADMAGVISDGKLGLGVSLLGNDETLTGKLGAQKFEEELLKNSAIYNQFLGLNDNTNYATEKVENFKLDPNKMVAYIGNNIKKYTDISTALNLFSHRGYKFFEIDDMFSMNYAMISEFLAKHSNKWLIMGKIKDFKLFDEKLSKFKDRIIIESWFDGQYKLAKKYGFKHLAYPLNNIENIYLVLANSYEFVTVSVEFLQQNKYTLQSLRRNKGVKIMVYGLKNKAEILQYDDLADMIYYDGDENITAP